MGFFNKYPYTDFHELNLDWLINQLKTLMEQIESLENWKDEFEKEYEEIKEIYEALINGDLPPAMQNAILEWCVNNLTELVARVLKQVFFGLTDTGYFCAFIPDSWDDIEFETSGYDTLYDYDYGHLVLSY